MDPQRVSKWLCIAAALMLCILLLYNAATVPSFLPLQVSYAESSDESSDILSSGSEAASSAPVSSLLPSGRWDLNLVSVEELCEIPGIGTVTAEKIINFRTEIGKFSEMEELLQIQGIGEKTLEKLRQYLEIPVLTDTE